MFGGRGVRTDKVWASDRAKIGEKPVKNAVLVDAIEWQHARRGAKMTAHDLSTLDALDNRTWGYRLCAAVRVRSLASWIAELMPSRRGSGYEQFIALVVGAYRAGACGVWLSYAEAMAVCRVGSESTWRRWTSEMEDLGLIRITQTWVPDETDSGRPRVYGALLYRIGATLEAHAEALCDGAQTPRTVKSKISRLAAAKRRYEQRSRCKTRLQDLYSRRAAGGKECYRPRGAADASMAPSVTPTSPPTSDATTPLRDYHNRNALPPSEVGGRKPPPDDVGIFQSEQPAPQAAPVAIGQADAAPLATSVDTAEAFAKLMRFCGAPKREIQRLTSLAASPRDTAPPNEPDSPLGRPRSKNAGLPPDVARSSADLRADPDRTGCENPAGVAVDGSRSLASVEIGGASVQLYGPLANELSSFFFRVRPIDLSNGSE